MVLHNFRDALDRIYEVVVGRVHPDQRRRDVWLLAAGESDDWLRLAFVLLDSVLPATEEVLAVAVSEPGPKGKPKPKARLRTVAEQRSAPAGWAGHGMRQPPP